MNLNHDIECPIQILKELTFLLWITDCIASILTIYSNQFKPAHSATDQNLYFKYSNSDSDKTILEKNTIKINFLPPASPIFMYCALVCFNKNFPDDQVIKDSSNVKKNPKDNLVKYYTGFFNDLTPKDIIFDKVYFN